MRFFALGPVEARVDQSALELGGAKRQALLLALLLQPRRVVPLTSLVTALWEKPPRSAPALVHTYVSTLRRCLVPLGGPPLLVTRSPGYLLDVAPEDNDLETFTATVATARNSGHGDAARLYRTALSLWRGPVFGGLDAPVARLREHALEEARLAAEEGLARALVGLGRHADAIPRLVGLTAEHPEREELRSALMLGLAAAGRQGEALAVFRDCRRYLVDELGVEPSGQLQELHARILDGPARATAPEPKPTAVAAAEPEPVVATPNQLPPDIADFTGRETQLARIITAAARGGTATPTVVLSGFGGTGKSALGVHAAHRLRSRYVDGTLFADLGGDAAGTTTAEVLSRFLRALGVTGLDIPEGFDHRAEMFRMKAAGRRILIVLDNARSEAQIRALLPGTPECLVLITSRARLTGLAGAEQIELTLFAPEQSVDMLSRIVGRERIGEDPEGAARIAELCGGIPLAIRVAGAKLLARPHWPLRSLVARLADERRRLDELTAGDLTIRASLSLNCDELGELAERAYHLLSLCDFPDFGAWIAAPLLDVSLDEADEIVERLVDLRFADVAGVDSIGRVRYRFHDLVRLFGAEQAHGRLPREQVLEALGRVVSTWIGLVRAGEAKLPRVTLAPRPMHLPARRIETSLIEEIETHPLPWLEAETAALVRTVERAHELGAGDLSTRLAVAVLSSAFSARKEFDGWARALDVALAAARGAHDHHAEAMILAAVGQLHYEGDEFDAAMTFSAEAVRQAQAVGDDVTLAVAEVTIGTVQRDRGEFAEARATLEAAATIADRLAEPTVLASASYGLGAICRDQGDLVEALDATKRCVELYRQLADPRGEAIALRGLGLAYRAQGDVAEALDLSVRSARILDRIGDELGAAYAVQSEAKALIRLRDTGRVAAMLEHSRAVCARNKDRFGLALIARTLGEHHLAAGATADAAVILGDALRQWQTLGLPLWVARTRRDLAAALCGTDPHTADAHWTEALAVYRALGSREQHELAATNPSEWLTEVVGGPTVDRLQEF
ncbi:AfsR/SARP family transcriptional regulator [Amycolatopsis sp. H20-H5]|uniref:AfsR/SARP family transcriptional regulator n=1 Tax=Amycolatopsis sp. H20-H5 TaxID=3046309 RepID=UPI002DBE29D8|nr:BTAD domain-containing putative transcriptional regulator [Amycolatopsis sp. H20-H5]MEC3981038.1 BTAD domain-containing putative transcriptional regulator [Amycolatopsis sp. H20-H5]